MHELTFLDRLRTMLDDGPVALATVLEVAGSVPRRPGAMMALAGERELGTVGGGAMEARILATMREVERGDPLVRRVAIDLGGRPDAVRDGICGGSMTIEVRRLGAADGERLAGATEALRAGRRIVLAAAGATPLDWRTASEPAATPAAPATPAAAATPATAATAATARDERAFVSDETGWSLSIRPRPVLLVVGGGHCGVALARQASLLDFEVVIEDDRDAVRHAVRATIDPQRGIHVVPGPTRDTLADIGPGRELLAALVTRSFRQDLDALDALRTWGAAYIGVMGSRRRLGTVFGLLREEGWTPEELAALDAPIGVDIGAETPAEIAVSIAAGLVRGRARRAASGDGRRAGGGPERAGAASHRG